MAKYRTKVEVSVVDGVPVAITTVDAFPRGSGNRKTMERLGAAVKSHTVLGQHVDRVVVSSSRVRVYWRSSWEMIQAMWAMQSTKVEDVPGQQLLSFGA